MYKSKKSEETKDENIVQRKGVSLEKKTNNTGLPDSLKSGMESLSGYSMDDVTVHYNSSKPAQLNAHAYAQGSEIHLASGQEKHLPHEAWHVVQQKQGRVMPTTQVGGVDVNDNPQLEKEADVMGTKAVQMKEIISEEAKSDVIDHSLTQLKVIQLGGAAANADADENIQATGHGLRGIQGFINELQGAGDNVQCKVGVMVRYPTWGNYLKAKGGHAAIQIQADFGGDEKRYLQAGVSATGSIQVEPIFHTVKTREGYNIKNLTKTVDKATCINVLKGVAKEIAIAQPYQERIVFNTGSKTNCSLWAAKMAEIAGINLGTVKMWILPSPNDLQHSLDYFKNKDGYEHSDSTRLQQDAEQINVNVGTVPAPQWDPETGDLDMGNLTQEEVQQMKDWARALD